MQQRTSGERAKERPTQWQVSTLCLQQCRVLLVCRLHSRVLHRRFLPSLLCFFFFLFFFFFFFFFFFLFFFFVVLVIVPALALSHLPFCFAVAVGEGLVPRWWQSVLMTFVAMGEGVCLRCAVQQCLCFVVVALNPCHQRACGAALFICVLVLLLIDLAFLCVCLLACLFKEQNRTEQNQSNLLCVHEKSGLLYWDWGGFVQAQREREREGGSREMTMAISYAGSFTFQAQSRSTDTKTHMREREDKIKRGSSSSTTTANNSYSSQHTA